MTWHDKTKQLYQLHKDRFKASHSHTVLQFRYSSYSCVICPFRYLGKKGIPHTHTFLWFISHKNLRADIILCLHALNIYNDWHNKVDFLMLYLRIRRCTATSKLTIISSFLQISLHILFVQINVLFTNTVSHTELWYCSSSFSWLRLQQTNHRLWCICLSFRWGASSNCMSNTDDMLTIKKISK